MRYHRLLTSGIGMGLLIPGATNPGLDLPDPNARDAGLYYAVIITPFGIVPGYIITLSDTNAGFNPVRFYRVFSDTPAP